MPHGRRAFAAERCGPADGMSAERAVAADPGRRRSGGTHDATADRAHGQQHRRGGRGAARRPRRGAGARRAGSSRSISSASRPSRRATSTSPTPAFRRVHADAASRGRAAAGLAAVHPPAAVRPPADRPARTPEGAGRGGPRPRARRRSARHRRHGAAVGHGAPGRGPARRLGGHRPVPLVVRGGGRRARPGRARCRCMPTSTLVTLLTPDGCRLLPPCRAERHDLAAEPARVLAARSRSTAARATTESVLTYLGRLSPEKGVRFLSRRGAASPDAAPRLDPAARRLGAGRGGPAPAGGAARRGGGSGRVRAARDATRRPSCARRTCSPAVAHRGAAPRARRGDGGRPAVRRDGLLGGRPAAHAGRPRRRSSCRVADAGGPGRRRCRR